MLQVASVVVEREVPGAGVHVLDEACFLEAAQQQAFGCFGSRDGIGQRPGQRLPVQQFHKVELDTHNIKGHTVRTTPNWNELLGIHQNLHKCDGNLQSKTLCSGVWLLLGELCEN